MKVAEIKDKAQELGITPGKMKKQQLIQAIQVAEQNTPCFGTTQGYCDQANCCFIQDCLKIRS